MSSAASERGGHARPRGLFAPRPRGGGVPGQRGAGSARNGHPSQPASGPPDQNGTAPTGRPARHVAPGPAARPGRKSSPAIRRARRSRIAALAVVVVGVLVIGLATGFGSEPSAEPAAQAFLLDWQQQQYAAASALTTGAPVTVAADLQGAFAQLDATQLFLTMKSVVQHGGTAEASFMATVDLAQQSRVWTYGGQFGLHRVDGSWKVDWAPGVVNPSLGPGDRLAVVTQFPARASVLDAEGDPLQLRAIAYVLGVWPDACPASRGRRGRSPVSPDCSRAGARPDRGCPAAQLPQSRHR